MIDFLLGVNSKGGCIARFSDTRNETKETL
jgi:hypothetical protein